MADAKFDEFGNKMVNDSANVTFKCPNCSEAEISRSKQARDLGKEYTCPKCGFVGP